MNALAEPEFTVADVVHVIERLYPPTLAEEWDRVGLVAGDPAAPVTAVALAVDPIAAIVDEALDWGADLLLTHHPLLLRGVSSVAATTFKGAIVHRLIRGGCALLSAHTNADAAAGGVADALARAIGVTEEVVPLVPRGADSPGTGIGRVGSLASPLTLRGLAQHVAAALPHTAQGVRVAGDLDASVSRIAVVGGAGDSLFDAVRASGADVYVAADLRHHPASEAREQAIFAGGGRPYLIDVPHSASEWPWLAYAAAQIEQAAAARGASVRTLVSRQSTDPWDVAIR